MLPSPEPRLRLATEADLPAINAIYNHYVHHSTCTYQIAPETDAARLVWFCNRSARHPVTVAEVAGEVVGWGALNRFHSREAFDRTVENSVYIHHAWQRRGLGRLLLADLIERARALDHRTIVAAISAEQTGSIALHRAFGFSESGRLREVGFKHGRWLDLVTLQLML